MRIIYRTLIAFFALLLSSCGGTNPFSTPPSTTPLSAGDTTDSEIVADWAERTLLLQINRARADVRAALAECRQCGESACYADVMPPVALSDDLQAAAQFHAVHLAHQQKTQHDTPCRLAGDIVQRFYAGTCIGQPNCACRGPGKTSWTARVGLFARDDLSLIGENAGRSGSSAGAIDSALTNIFDAWLFEPYSSSSCEPGKNFLGRTNRHRFLILHPDVTHIGIGVRSRESRTRMDNYWVVDFAQSSDPRAMQELVVGTHYPYRMKPQSRGHLYLHRYTKGMEPSTDLFVEVGDRCIQLDGNHIERGNAAHGIYRVEVRVEDGACVPYSFATRDAGGRVTRLPNNDLAYVIPIGNAQCEAQIERSRACASALGL